MPPVASSWHLSAGAEHVLEKAEIEHSATDVCVFPRLRENLGARANAAGPSGNRHAILPRFAPMRVDRLGVKIPPIEKSANKPVPAPGQCKLGRHSCSPGR
jgi:hypothetical protein